MQYNDGYTESVYAFANTINTVDGGTHLTGLRSALTRTSTIARKRQGLLKDDDPNFTGDDTREGLTAIVSVKLPDPQFETQTKVKLLNAEVEDQVESVVGEALDGVAGEEPPRRQEIIEKCLTSSRARDAARKARDLVIRKSALESMTLPGKLADCSERDRRSASCTSSRATRPAAAPSRAATAASRRFCRCAARSSTSRRPAWTRCSPTTRSRR